MDCPRVSLVITVRNEETALPALLDSLEQQERQPDEIVIADGGSTDRTLPLLRAFASEHRHVSVLDLPGSNISQGRNAAIRAATGDVIAVTDAGVSLPAFWLAELVRPLEQRADVDMVSGFSRAAPKNRFEALLAATTLPLVSEVCEASYLASSRTAAFRRALWEESGGYPEWLDYSEDVVFDLNCKTLGAHVVFQPAATVRFRPRPDVRAFFLQYYRYARGDGKANLWPGRHALRYIAYVLSAVMLWQGRANPVWWLLLVLAAIAATRRPLIRVLTEPASRSLASLAQSLGSILVLRIVGDIAKMLGYPVGVWWRWRMRRTRTIQ